MASVLLLLVGSHISVPSLCHGEVIPPLGPVSAAAAWNAFGEADNLPVPSPNEGHCFCSCKHIQPEALVRAAAGLAFVDGDPVPGEESGLLRVSRAIFHPPKS